MYVSGRNYSNGYNYSTCIARSVCKRKTVIRLGIAFKAHLMKDINSTVIQIIYFREDTDATLFFMQVRSQSWWLRQGVVTAVITSSSSFSQMEVSRCTPFSEWVLRIHIYGNNNIATVKNVISWQQLAPKTPSIFASNSSSVVAWIRLSAAHAIYNCSLDVNCPWLTVVSRTAKESSVRA